LRASEFLLWSGTFSPSTLPTRYQGASQQKLHVKENLIYENFRKPTHGPASTPCHGSTQTFYFKRISKLVLIFFLRSYVVWTLTSTNGTNTTYERYHNVCSSWVMCSYIGYINYAKQYPLFQRRRLWKVTLYENYNTHLFSSISLLILVFSGPVHSTALLHSGVFWLYMLKSYDDSVSAHHPNTQKSTSTLNDLSIRAHVKRKLEIAKNSKVVPC
jgi:hypothetical protein